MRNAASGAREQLATSMARDIAARVDPFRTWQSLKPGPAHLNAWSLTPLAWRIDRVQLSERYHSILRFNCGGTRMETLLIWLGRLAGVAGVVLCVIAGATRLLGAYWLGQFQTTTLLQVGIAGMVLGCLCLLLALLERLGEYRKLGSE